MKFRGLRRRAPCRRLSGWIAQHRDRSGSPSQLLWHVWDLGFCMHMCTVALCTYSCRARGCHRGVKNRCQSVRQKAKSCGRGRKSVSSSCTDCSCKPAEKTVLVEIDTWTRKQKQTKRIIHAEQQKSVVETDSKSSKIIDPGASRGDSPSGAKGRLTT